MVKKCPFCGEINEDKFNYCSNCGNPLFNTEDIHEGGFSPEISSKKLIILGYIFTIIFCWGGVILSILSLFSSIGFIGIFGLFLPFYLTHSEDPTIRKHGYIQMILSVLGLVVTFGLMFYSLK